MREIKFRGKSVDSGKWVYGYYVLRPFQTHCIYVSDFVEEIAPDTLGQYIGLKDKDGREIYEGDIVHYRAATEDSFPNPTAEYDGVVYYDECGELCFGNFFAIYCSSVLVLGNIYENPELLDITNCDDEERKKEAEAEAEMRAQAEEEAEEEREAEYREGCKQ